MHEQSAMGSETRAKTDRVTKQIVTIFSKTCNKLLLLHSYIPGPLTNNFPDLIFENRPKLFSMP